ncbi:hypothetical protein GBA63_12440 [Rubrobacter tropicus]|uniref:Uncharacterized protein n=1 Tax=Rubrobacter tropicus TaxID=2653851 RepID=A0A6G8QA88_9ACTN|nr:hypothetical protein [Rubrobacter tropicus]QIN83353.1 hypothetical protein GBA63_12440 [Rubrobacter tropicus]
MASRGESRAEVRGELARLGWEVREGGAPSGAVIGAHGKYYLMVSFGDDGPTSVIISYVGRGGGLLSRGWPGVERLPSPRNVVKALSHRP